MGRRACDPKEKCSELEAEKHQNVRTAAHLSVTCSLHRTILIAVPLTDTTLSRRKIVLEKPFRSHRCHSYSQSHPVTQSLIFFLSRRGPYHPTNIFAEHPKQRNISHTWNFLVLIAGGWVIDLTTFQLSCPCLCKHTSISRRHLSEETSFQC